MGARSKTPRMMVEALATTPSTPAPAALEWEVVLLDRALLNRVKWALHASSTSEVIDRALMLAALHQGTAEPDEPRSYPVQ